MGYGYANIVFHLSGLFQHNICFFQRFVDVAVWNEGIYSHLLHKEHVFIVLSATEYFYKFIFPLGDIS